MDVYAHLFPGTFSRLVDALDDATSRNPRATAALASVETVSTAPGRRSGP